jgi:PAS domain S-box-containing protein
MAPANNVSLSEITVLVVDDDAVLAGALAETIESASDMHVAGIAHDSRSAIESALQSKPDVVVMDVRMPGGGVAATRGVLEVTPHSRVLGLSAHEDATTARQMIEAGAIGYVVKGMPEEEILDAIRRAARGQLSLPGELGGTMIRDLSQKLEMMSNAESILRASEERVNALLDGVPDAIFLIDVHGKIEMLNATASRMFGYAHGEMIGLAVESLVPERFRPRHETLRGWYTDHPRTRPLHSGLELYGLRKGGTEFPVEIALSPIETAAGMAVVVAVREATETRADDLARRKQSATFRAVLQSAPDAMVAVDADGLIHVVNDQAEKLFGYTRAELIGMSVDQLVPDGLRSAHAGHRGKFLRSPRVRPMGLGLELYARRRDGSDLPVDISLSHLQTEDGVLVVAAVRDISERRLAERRQAEDRQAVDRRRQMALLVHTQEEERRKIAGDIHDDSIQAMTATSLRLQQLRRRLTDPQQLELLGKLDEAVRESIIRLRRMVFDLRPAALDRSGLTAALRELLERLREDTGVDFTLEDVTAVEPAGDLRVEIYRIAQEALTNVRKHSAAHKVTVDLQHAQDGFLVRIADDGVGFAHAERNGSDGHVGLIAMRERAEIAGGWLKVTSARGHGTTIEFWLPDDRAGSA